MASILLSYVESDKRQADELAEVLGKRATQLPPSTMRERIL